MFCLVMYKLNMYNKNEELIKKVDKANGNVSGVLLYAKSYSEDIDSNFMNNKNGIYILRFETGGKAFDENNILALIRERLFASDIN